MTKSQRLKELLSRPEPTVLMEAHNGLSAKLVEEAGFEAIWGSGLSISAALGVRDSNEASWTQVLEVLEFMSDAVKIPMLLDGDTGYGNFNNMRRLVQKLEQRGVAGVCIEDKLFPKTNSFLHGDKQALAEIDEFSGKIRAAKDTQQDPDFVVVARTEAFIAGWGLQEALLRATAYAESGADAILVHSARKDSQEILAFMKAWTLSTPIVIVPTKYPTEPMSKFVEAGVTNFIFANQCIRTVVTSLKDTLKKLRETNDLMSVEKQIAPVSEIFRLQNVDELEQAEERYLPQKKDSMRAVVLAATKGNFGDLTKEKPKVMLRLAGKPVLTWHMEALNRQGIKQIGVVRGYKKESVDITGLHYFDNDDYASTGELASLAAARDFLAGDTLVAYGDVIYDHTILQQVVDSDADMTIAVDVAWTMRDRVNKAPDLVRTTGPAAPNSSEQPRLVGIAKGLEAGEATGEWLGLLALRGKGVEALRAEMDAWFKADPSTFRRASLPDLLARLLEKGQRVAVVHTYGHWRDLDEQADLLEFTR